MSCTETEPTENGSSPPRQSLLRTWTPAILAILAAASLNLYNLGPYGEHIPAPTERHLHLAAVRTELESKVAELVESDPDPIGDAVRRHKFGSRHLSESEGGDLEYTRRRHRALREYTHKDVADEFSSFGKWSVVIFYVAYWVLLMFPNWFLPIGRPGIALAGALNMVIFRAMLYKYGHGPIFVAENLIYMDPLFLLFGIMLSTIYLETMECGGMFDRLRKHLDDPINWKRCAKIMFLSTVGSAAVMNDSIVLIFSGVVVELCVKNKVMNSLPYLLALATTANIGSAMAMTGNPQNILIVTLAYDDIGWIEFASNMIIPVIASTAMNCFQLFAMYSSELFPGSSGIFQNFKIMFLGARTKEMLTQEHAWHVRHQIEKMEADPDEEDDPTDGPWTVWTYLQVAILILHELAFALGLDVCVTAISAGVVLMVINAYKRQHFDEDEDEEEYDSEGNVIPKKKMYDMDGNEIIPEKEELLTESDMTLTEVDYGLLMLFIGQFILIGSFDDTGVPQAIWNFMMGGCADQMAEGACLYWFVTIITILSNFLSNVPICQMLAATFPYATPYEWMHVSWSATIAGNLTMLGSAANMIVAFQAAKVGDRTFTSERHAPFGVPSTIGCLYLGSWIMTKIYFSPDCSVKLGTCE